MNVPPWLKSHRYQLEFSIVQRTIEWSLQTCAEGSQPHQSDRLLQCPVKWAGVAVAAQRVTAHGRSLWQLGNKPRGCRQVWLCYFSQSLPGLQDLVSKPVLTQHNTAAQCSSGASLSPRGCLPSLGAGREPDFPRAKGSL